MELLDLKKQALLQYLKESNYLETTIEDITEGYNESNFKVFGNEFNIFTEEEREEAIAEYIKESLWAFNASFILQNSHIRWNNQHEYSQIEKALKEMQEKLCESANPLILVLIKNNFVKNAIEADGYGHFLSGYDGKENEEYIKDIENQTGQYFYIYRQN
jgi:hypothetical protein